MLGVINKNKHNIFHTGTCDICYDKSKGLTITFPNHSRFICNQCIEFISINCRDAITNERINKQDFENYNFKSVTSL
jgi:predicted RNA-binding protein with PUA domain